jgi:hypothetical protein
VMLRDPVKHAFMMCLSLLFRSELTNAVIKFPAGLVSIPPLRSAWGENTAIVAVDSANDPASNLGPELNNQQPRKGRLRTLTICQENFHRVDLR